MKVDATLPSLAVSAPSQSELSIIYLQILNMKKNEKQLEAKSLYRQLPVFEFAVFEFRTRYNTKGKGHVCLVNNVAYIRVGDLSCPTSYVQRLVKIGPLSREDILVGRQNGGGQYFDGRLCTLLKLQSLEKVKGELVRANRLGHDEEEMDSYISSAKEVTNMPFFDLSPEAVATLWLIYDRRNQLITEGTRERKAEGVMLEREELERGSGMGNETGMEGLAELVDRIESLGWHVTLTRKENKKMDTNSFRS